MKRWISTCLAALLLFGCLYCLGACRDREKPEEPAVEFDYDGLYRSRRQERYPEDGGLTSRASHGYTLVGEQGYNGWYYLEDAGDGYREMTYNASDSRFEGKGAALDGISMLPGSAAAVRKYVTKHTGAAVIYGNYRRGDDGNGTATVEIRQGDRLLYTGTLAPGDTVGNYVELEAEVNEGDVLYFRVSGDGCRVEFNPVVTFEHAENLSLYHKTAAGHLYGDVFPYYSEKEHRLYMGFLWSDDARAGNYTDALEVSDNLLTFTDVPEANHFDEWERYRQEYRLHYRFPCNRFVESKYTFGMRDNFLYFDEKNQRYLLIAGCYYRFDAGAQTSDLVIYQSDDPNALSWTRPGNVVEAGYSRNLPECPSLMKIGDRWYVFVSVAYNTAHQVGPLQYWTGDAGVDCMDVDWSGKDFSFLDGEDLCAARVTKVGEKVYLWGWIPATYDTMPWSPWGGYLNLPREVVQRADGSLGGRLDPGLSKLLNYGRIYEAIRDGFGCVSGSAERDGGAIRTTGETLISLTGGLKRNYVTFDVDLGESRQVAYVMKQGDREYRAVIAREDGKTYLKVLSPGDPKHPVNSVLEIGDLTKATVKLVTDGGFVEFFVNDEYALTAHTAMEDAPYDAYLCSSSDALFRDVNIHKLIPYGELD